MPLPCLHQCLMQIRNLVAAKAYVGRCSAGEPNFNDAIAIIVVDAYSYWAVRDWVCVRDAWRGAGISNGNALDEADRPFDVVELEEGAHGVGNDLNGRSPSQRIDALGFIDSYQLGDM